MTRSFKYANVCLRSAGLDSFNFGRKVSKGAKKKILQMIELQLNKNSAMSEEEATSVANITVLPLSERWRLYKWTIILYYNHIIVLCLDIRKLDALPVEFPIGWMSGSNLQQRQLQTNQVLHAIEWLIYWGQTNKTKVLFTARHLRCQWQHQGNPTLRNEEILSQEMEQR